jgi:short-subunit dehydrogenase
MNKTVLITGASGGIGLELARIHASKGDNLVLVARSEDKLNKIKSELEHEFKIRVYNIVKDLSVKDSAVEVYKELHIQNISVDYLVNNAGLGDFGLFEFSDWTKQESMINLNITALVHLTRLFLPDMIKRGEGRILNVASTAAFQPGPKMSVYFGTKAFVLHFSEAINNEVMGKGVTVTALCPGSTESDFHAVALGDSSLVKNRNMASSRKVAMAGYMAMMKGKPVVIPGIKNWLMAFAVRFFPRDFIVKMAGRIQEKKNYNRMTVNQNR